MFGSKRAHSAHPDATTVSTTTHTTKTTSPHYPSKTTGIMDRLRPRKTNTTYAGTQGKPVRNNRTVKKFRPATTTTAIATPRKASMGDKVSGAMMKLKGGVTNKPGEKAAGYRRMEGTDGRVAPRYY